LSLGGEQRLGQVVRAWRSDLLLDEGTFTIRGREKKGGVVLELTKGQRAAAEKALKGYLSDLEQAGGDYRLFPSGQLPGGRKGEGRATEKHRNAKQVGARRITSWFIEAEELAGVEHLRGRGPYGVRRVAVDSAKGNGISREGLKEYGGWTDTQVPDMIYAAKKSEKARKEACEMRARFRGEETSKPEKNVTPA
jgi:hypothetical protein